MTEERLCLKILQFLQAVLLFQKKLVLNLKTQLSNSLVVLNQLRFRKRTQLSLTVQVIKMQSQQESLRLEHRWKRQHQTLTKKNFRKDLQNLQAELLLSVSELQQRQRCRKQNFVWKMLWQQQRQQ